MEEEIKNRLDKQEELLLKIYNSAERTRKYFLATLIISVVAFFVPLIALVIILPKVLSTYLSAFEGL